MKTKLSSKKDGAISVLGYSGMATAFLAVAPNVNAQVVHVDIDPDEVLFHDSYHLDLDADGTVDLTIIQFNTPSGASSGTTFGSQFAILQIPPGNAVLGSHPGNYFYASRLASGDAIAPGATNFQAQGTLAFRSDSFNWGGQTGFLGCRFVASDGMDHYGWVQLSVSQGLFITTVMDYGYDLRPNTGISAGDIGLTTGTAENGASKLQMDIIPNPATDRAMIGLPAIRTADMRISLLTCTGQMVFTDMVGAADKYSLNLADQDPGIYFVQLRDGKNVVYGKVAKQ